VDVHRVRDILRVPVKESSIGREASLTTATNYTRPNRLLYCVSMLPEIVLLYSTIVCCHYLFEVNNEKCNFLESIVFVLLYLGYRQRKNSTYNIQNTSISFDSFVDR